ncbi:hypothetical protein V0M98_33350 (plasmid) [Pseudomonas silesiensis]|uniref:hypothetical protein n=1 Tax=Pseudomonas silesiensis TaxID=1853130 RepID=UPI0030D2C2EB
MNKQVLLLCSMLLTMPAMAAESKSGGPHPIKPPITCFGVAESATFVMGGVYSVAPSSVTVDILDASKLESDSAVFTKVLTNQGGRECQMEWTTLVIGSVMACMPDLRSLSCKTVAFDKTSEDLSQLRKLREAADAKQRANATQPFP